MTYVEPDVLGGDVELLDMFVLFAAENVDHNTITIDGKGTSWNGCHCLCHSWNTDKPSYSARKKLKTRRKFLSWEYMFARHACHKVVFEDLPRIFDSDNRIDILCDVSLGFKEVTPNWQGMIYIYCIRGAIILDSHQSNSCL